jgi:cytochrome c oxidase assembly protein subunit 15
LITIWTIIAFRLPKNNPIVFKLRILPIGLVSLQILLGILSLLNSLRIVPNQWGAFEWLALFHQITGMLLLLSLVGILYFLTPKYRTQQL